MFGQPRRGGDGLDFTLDGDGPSDGFPFIGRINQNDVDDCPPTREALGRLLSRLQVR